MTHPINIKGGAALDWTREHPGMELVAGMNDSLRIRFTQHTPLDESWEYQDKRIQYPVNWERLTEFQWVLARSWSAPQRVLPPTPKGYWWNVDKDTGEPISLARVDDACGRTVPRTDDDVSHLRELIEVYQTLIAEYEGRVKP